MVVVLVITWKIVKEFLEWAFGKFGEGIVLLVEQALELFKGLIKAVEDFSMAVGGFATAIVELENLLGSFVKLFWFGVVLIFYVALVSLVIVCVDRVFRLYGILIDSIKSTFRR